MGRGSYNKLIIKSSAEVARETKTFIENRRNGREKSLKVRSNKVNKTFMNGIDWNRIITIAGISGSGKSTIARQWVKEMLALNTDQEFDVLSFQFEMLGVDEVARDLSSITNIPIKKLYSAEGQLNNAEVDKISTLLADMEKLPISVVDNIGTVDEIHDTIIYYVNNNSLAERNRGLVITLDHTLLVKAGEYKDEKGTIDQLMHMRVGLKKHLANNGVKSIFIILSQLNRNIESTERVINSNLHYPNKNDLFGASSVYYSSDYVIIIHRPCLIDGLGNWYGPKRPGFREGLPVFNPENPDQPMVYLHVIKERFGNNRIISMVDELSFGRISEYN